MAKRLFPAYCVIWTVKHTSHPLDSELSPELTVSETLEWARKKHPYHDVWVYELGDLVATPDIFKVLEHKGGGA